MADNLFTTCDPATSRYDFVYPLSWSNKCEVAELLSDIPFISVGILVFGMSALLLVIKRVSVSAVWLFFSTLLAFVAVVLDLGRTLADGVAMNTTKVIASEPIVTVREVLFGFSTGLRFLFYWSYVAEPPRNVFSAAPAKMFQRFDLPTFECAHEPHSGSWTRWGLPGKLLGIGLSVAITLITALQIVWRVVPRFHQYNNVYGTDAALQLLVSFLLLLKLLSNTITLNSPDDMLVHTFGECLAPISGLLLNIAIGVGALLCFAFTESTVGRLLQALEVYIIVVFVVVTAFLRHRDILLPAASPRGKKHRDVVFTLPEPTRSSTFRITPPVIETPRMSMILGSINRYKESSREALHRSARRSLYHVSSWVSSRISRSRARCEDDDEVKLWNSERIKVNPPYTGNIDVEPSRSSTSLATQESMGELPRDASANHTSIISALDAQSAIVRSMEDSVDNDQMLHPSRANVQQRTILPQARTSPDLVSSVPSQITSGVKHAVIVSSTPEVSPVYGLSGIQSLSSAFRSRTSLGGPLRQQSHLEQSTEALGLFSAGTSANSNLSHSNSIVGRRSAELTRSPSSGQRTVSSEVSLSNFPIPPWITTPVPALPSSRLSSVKRIQGNRRARFPAARSTLAQDTHAPVEVPSLSAAPLVDIRSSPCFNSIPHTPPGEERKLFSGEVRECFRSDSGGTQYNVTSFIGGLATPGEAGQASQEMPRRLTENESSIDAKLPPHILPVPQRLEEPPATPTEAKPSPGTRSPRLSQGDVVNQPAKVVQYQTKDRTSCALQAASSPVMDHAENGIAILPIELVREADPPVTVSAAGANRTQKTFVRRRPPPLVIQGYTEQNSGMPVLADD